MVAPHAPGSHQDHGRTLVSCPRISDTSTDTLSQEIGMQPSDAGNQTINRKPIRNFIFDPRSQWPQILRNGLLVVFTSMGTGLAILYLYSREFGSMSVYVMDRNSAFYPLDRQSLISMIFPAILATTLSGLFLGWLLTFGASRRIALPIFKVKQWAQRIAEGDLHVRLGFRKHDGLEDLADQCNAALDRLRSGYEEIESIRQDTKIPEDVRRRLGDILSRYQTEKT